MKTFSLLFLAFLFVACSGKAPEKNILWNENIPNEDLLQTLKNSYLYSNYDVSNSLGYNIHKSKEEIAETLKIVDTFRIEGYEQTLVLYSFSIGSDILRESRNYKKQDGKWYHTFLYTSTYNNNDPFKDGNEVRALEILDKEEKWIEESEEIKKRIFGN